MSSKSGQWAIRKPNEVLGESANSDKKYRLSIPLMAEPDRMLVSRICHLPLPQIPQIWISWGAEFKVRRITSGQAWALRKLLVSDLVGAKEDPAREGGSWPPVGAPKLTKHLPGLAERTRA